MSKLYSSFTVVVMTIILQAQTIAKSSYKELDMNTYAAWAGYGFLVVIALAFMYFLYYSSSEIEARELVKPKKAIHSSIVPLKLTGEISASLNLVFYLLISLILLNITLLVLFIT